MKSAYFFFVLLFIFIHSGKSESRLANFYNNNAVNFVHFSHLSVSVELYCTKWEWTVVLTKCEVTWCYLYQHFQWYTLHLSCSKSGRWLLWSSDYHRVLLYWYSSFAVTGQVTFNWTILILEDTGSNFMVNRKYVILSRPSGGSTNYIYKQWRAADCLLWCHKYWHFWSANEFCLWSDWISSGKHQWSHSTGILYITTV